MDFRDDFLHKYSNSHLTQHLFLHYLGKTELMKYYILYKAVLSVY